MPLIALEVGIALPGACLPCKGVRSNRSTDPTMAPVRVQSNWPFAIQSLIGDAPECSGGENCVC